jgi:hypothetical protein
MKSVMLAGLLLGIFILLSGCASTSTSITSFTDPDYKSFQFNKILVISNTSKLSYRLGMENRIVEVLAANGIKSIPSYSILPPTREFSDTQKKELMQNKEIDGCLMINFGEQGVKEISIPITGSTSRTTVLGNSINTSTQYIGGETFSLPYAEFEIKLFDISNGKMAWIANSFTGGNAYSNFNNVYWSFCIKIIERLSSDNLIRTSEVLSHIFKKEIDKIIKEREDSPELFKDDVIVLNSGEIIKGIILDRYVSNDQHEDYVEIRITKVDEKKDILKILLKDIREVYQK